MLGVEVLRQGKRNKSSLWVDCGFGPIKSLAQFAGSRINYLKILQVTRHVSDWKPAWMADLRVDQDGLNSLNSRFSSILQRTGS